MQLFAWGTNSHGQLGQGYESELVSVPMLTALPEELENAIAHNCQITGGGNHSIISSNGRIWGTGFNNVGQLCSIEKKSISFFSEIHTLTSRNITSVACGWDFSLFLAADGTLYGCGSSSFGQLGILSNETVNLTELQNTGTHPFSQVSAGLRNSVAVTSNGYLQVWGSEKYVKQVSGLSAVVKVSCGQQHIVALNTLNQLIAWGTNNHGQCGQERLKQIQYPSAIEWDEENGKILDVVSGWTHCMVLTDRQQVYTWGRNTYGQLGRASLTNTFRPEKIPELEGITSIAAGSEHSMALDKLGQVWAWGWNEHGSIGNGSVENQFRPVNISHYFSGQVRSIGAGAGHSFAIVE